MSKPALGGGARRLFLVVGYESVVAAQHVCTPKIARLPPSKARAMARAGTTRGGHAHTCTPSPPRAFKSPPPAPPFDPAVEQAAAKGFRGHLDSQPAPLDLSMPPALAD